MDILKKEICFLSKETLYCTKNKKNYNKEVILSPYYYWYFEKKLPVSNIKRARAIASQMLEHLLPQNVDFLYVLKEKEKNIFEIFVVNKDLLIGKLQTMGIKKEMVSTLCFSHKELDECSLELENSIVIHHKENAAELPKNIAPNNTLLHKSMQEFLEEKEKLNFKYNFSKGNILQKSLDILETNFLGVSIALVLILISIVMRIMTLDSITTQYNQKEKELLKTQKYATYSVQLKYVMDELMQLDFKQKSFKKNFQNIVKIHGNSTTYLSNIEYDDGDLFVNVVSPNKQKADNLMKNKKFNFVRVDKNIYKYEKVK